MRSRQSSLSPHGPASYDRSCTRLHLASLIVVSLFALSVAGIGSQRDALYAAQEQRLLDDSTRPGLSSRDQLAATVITQQVSEQISNIEWLAPLAPVALSPFFGITILSGLACYGSEWLPENALLSPSSSLANPAIFWSFLVLTVLTSAPKLSKVSKPLAQLADVLEAYAAVVVLIVMRMMAGFGGVEPPAGEAAAAGVLAIGWDGLMLLMMAANILVINAVKFFFEFLVWLTPVPFLDACFEFGNKAVCAALMAIYAFSPGIAFAINVSLFLICAIMFLWIRRREDFYRTMLIGWFVNVWKRNRGGESPSAAALAGIRIFPANAVGSIPCRARCRLERKDDVWLLTCRRFLRRPLTEQIEGFGEITPGWWINAIVWNRGNDADNAVLHFSQRFNICLASVAEQWDLPLKQQEPSPSDQPSQRAEFG